VLALTRSDAGAKSLIAAGAEVYRGDLNDLENLRKGPVMSDGVIRLAFIENFSKWPEVCEVDRRAIKARPTAGYIRGLPRPPKGQRFTVDNAAHQAGRASEADIGGGSKRC
jgi:hypothetical protein